MSILIYGFSNQWGTNISRRVLTEIQKLIKDKYAQIDYQIISFHPRHFYQKYINHSHYSLIIGLGDFFGDIHRIRIETQSFNKYGDLSIDSFSPISLELSLPNLDLVDTNKFSISEHMGTYNCNWIAFQIQKEINNHSPQTKQLFFHLPKKSNAQILAQDIVTLLRANQMIQ